ncbi:MAG: UDP-3-O-(3-hydroxymyristoyl)glucosamine N-acyltransferase, partial [Kiritimatiellaeota bacterium]|nr:UDP-3-O-(3-hydroxymyristoyl)glucosamine N-acyltransferase [Kiritimatiellota bacterium]
MTIYELAKLVGGEVRDGGVAAVSEITGVASLRDAQAGDISFLANKKYAPLLATTKATAVFVAAEFAAVESNAALVVVASPDAAFAQTVPLFVPPPPVRAPGIHPTAVIGENVTMGEGVHIGPNAVIGDGALIGAFSIIGANVVVGEGVKMGERCHLHPLSSVRERCVLGNRVTLHNGAVIGSDGYGY